jgi:soluble lytic murein transglycosylase
MSSPRAIGLLLLLGCSLAARAVSVPGPDDTSAVEAERAAFKTAWTLARKGDLAALTPYLTELQDYPLAPYLDYAYLRATLDNEPDAAVEDFLARHSELPVTGELRRAWLLSLGKRQQWIELLANTPDEDDLALRCVVVAAHLLPGTPAQHPAWAVAAQHLWLALPPQDEACSPLFDYLKTQHLISGDMQRHRAQAALQARDWTSARALLPDLEAGDREWVETWLDMADDPARVLEGLQVPDEPRYQELLLSGIRLVARNEPLRAQHLLTSLGQRYRFSHDDRRDLRTLIALQHAWHLMPDAREQLKHLKDARDPEVPEWRARLAIRDGDWHEALNDIVHLADAEAPEWRYWRARALAELGRDKDARWLYRGLAKIAD